MSIDNCTICGGRVDTDMEPEVYRAEYSHVCICERCYDSESWQVGTPTYIGTYRVEDNSGTIGFAYWSGTFWGETCEYHNSAWETRNSPNQAGISRWYYYPAEV